MSSDTFPTGERISAREEASRLKVDARLDRFKALVEPQLETLYRVARRLTGNRVDAEDLVQETCLSAWQKLPADAESAHVDRWLLRVLYHRFIDGTRRTRRSPLKNGADDPSETLPSPTPGPYELAARDEIQRAFTRAWLKLEPAQQALLSLRAEGCGLVEIEAITGISRDVLRARLQRARASLARHLAATEAAHDAPSLAGRRL